MGPLRTVTSDLAPTAKSAPMISPDCALRDQGVVGLQVKQQGDTAEVRLRLRQGGDVVEASFRETRRGVEIQLVAAPEHHPLLNRVAEALASGRGNQAFELDGVTVDTDGDPTHPRHQRPGSAPASDDSTPRRHHRTGTQPNPAHPAGQPAGAGYLC